MPLQLSDLLSRGYFPKELPTPFTTQEYSSATTDPSTAPSVSIFKTAPKFSIPYVHNLVRTGGLRRNLIIPNPKHFFLLARHVVSKWSDLSTFASTSPYSLTKPVTVKPDRAISPKYELKERTAFRARLRSTNRYILKADISRFFPSIYTHSIPWAIMGKTAAKAAHSSRTLKGSWMDKLDMYSRSVINNQTIGIPIGPDTSRLLAEVILTRIDIELANKFPQLNGIRYIDDYEFAVSTRFKAEEVLSHLQHLLNDFELALNGDKTKIVELPDLLEQMWTSKIRIFIFRDAGSKGQINDLTAYFDMIFDLFKKFPNEGLMKYAIARLRSEEIRRENWPMLESLLNQCVIIEPACIPQVFDQLTYYKSKRYKIRKDIWSKCLNTIVYERVPLGQSSEAVWAMWLLNLLKIKLSAKSAKIVSQSDDSTVGLMALGLVEKGLARMSNLTGLFRFSDSRHLFENQWLLCYQGNLMSWLGPTSGRVNLRTDPVFEFLESQNVSFFDIGVTPPAPIRYAGLFASVSGGY